MPRAAANVTPVGRRFRVLGVINSFTRLPVKQLGARSSSPRSEPPSGTNSFKIVLDIDTDPE